MEGVREYSPGVCGRFISDWHLAHDHFASSGNRHVGGGDSGFKGMLIAGIIGSITLIPGFIAFPLAKAVLDMGAGIQQVAVFISTLMMVGVVTAPLERQFFSTKVMLLRNGMSFVFAFVVAYVLGQVMML